ncbi:MAG TPA: hypothetical protein DDW17_09825 [Deltaproteobacteria bacterium]|nr:hypothetical protein [Deltaproteobacteria bacterium]
MFSPLYEKLKQAENYSFDFNIDIQIINHYKRNIPFIGAPKVDIPAYRCYFFENYINICGLHNLSPREYNILKRITNEPGLNPYIEHYILFENRVIAEGNINAAIFAHIIFHFHHRIANKFVLQDYIKKIYEEEG